MSMWEALRRMPGSFFAREEEQPSETKRAEIVDEYAVLVSLAKQPGAIDRQSTTWAYVTSWAAREILRARASMDTCKDGLQNAALRERIRTLKDLLAADAKDSRKRIEVKGYAPDIP